MKFLADINISPQTVKELRSEGIDIARIDTLLQTTASDQEIIALAIKLDAVIITHDLDFSSIIMQLGKNCPSLMSLRLKNAHPATVTKILKNTIPMLSEALEDGSIISVDEEHIRIRKFVNRSS